MKKMRIPGFVILSLLLPLLSGAQSRKYSNEFLSIGVGARALGMSNAQVAMVNDVTAGYWNPAGLLGIKNNMQLSLMHAEYFAGIANYDYGALAVKFDSVSTGALSLIRFGVDNIPNTTELLDANGNIDYNRITTFSAADYGILFSYARILPVKGLRTGANMKIIRRKVGDFGGAWGFGLDAGAQYDYKQWRLGAMVRDLTSTFNAWTYDLTEETKKVFADTDNEIPENSVEITLPRLILGGTRRFEFWKSKISLEPEIDLDVTFDGKRNVLLKSKAASIDPHLGFEVGYQGIVFLRGGIGNIQKSQDDLGNSFTTFQPNFGVGLKLKVFTIDYALTDIGDQSVALYSNIFSLKFDINKNTK